MMRLGVKPPVSKYKMVLLTFVWLYVGYHALNALIPKQRQLPIDRELFAPTPEPDKPKGQNVKTREANIQKNQHWSSEVKLIDEAWQKQKELENESHSLNDEKLGSKFNPSHPIQKKPAVDLQLLVSELKKKLDILQPEVEVVNKKSTCSDLHIDYDDKCTKAFCPQKFLPENLDERIKQLTLRPNLQVPQNYRDVITDMAEKISGYYDIILVSAISSNHYMEAQAMFKNIHEKVLPILKNFTFVVYDLGLTDDERNQVRTYCRCTLLRFPFERFPEHFRTLKCFSWKVTVIRAMYEKANLVMWSDASIRFTRPQILMDYVERARQLGLQQRYLTRRVPNPYHTLTQMFEYFGDSPCAYMAFHQVETGFGIYHKEPLVQHAILDPWYGCAVRASCICPVEQKQVQMCPFIRGPKIGGCMRNEQSAISIILAKLFREKYRAIVVNVGSFQKAVRDQTYPYFDELRKINGQ